MAAIPKFKTIEKMRNGIVLYAHIPNFIKIGSRTCIVEHLYIRQTLTLDGQTSFPKLRFVKNSMLIFDSTHYVFYTTISYVRKSKETNETPDNQTSFDFPRRMY